MATQPTGNLDFEEQRMRIVRAIEEVEKMSAETRKLLAGANKVGAETKAVPFATVFQGLIAIAGLLGAGAAIAKLFFP
ncbi:MAG: hypothetical protein PGN23_16275 [Sphingomonas adhaesiva]|uniref:hypothetical protein n=1 Tax=Sphingomonas adhaesiva TaxID=28212 RepID=UPI002FFD187B